MSQVVSDDAKLLMADAIAADTATLSGAVCHLFINDITPARGDDSTAFDLPTWSGYGSETFTWQSAYLTPASGVELVGTSCFFESGSDADTICYGATIWSDAGVVITSERFASPVPVTGVTGLTVVPRIDLRNL